MPLPTKHFIAQPYLGSLQGWRGALGGIFFLNNDLEELSFKNLASGPAFLYLFRRFGFPIHHSDDFKDVCSYHITTPRPDVVLWIKIAASQVWFGYFLDSEMHRQCLREECEDIEMQRDKNRYKTAEESMRNKCLKALLVAIDNLKLATHVRDEYLNVFGPIADENVNDYECVNYSPIMNEWFKLLDNIAARGDGDFLKGLRLMNKESQSCSTP